MINYLQGTVVDCDGTTITLMVQGVGFEIVMPTDGLLLFDIGEETGVYTYMHVRETEIGLYGFRELLDKKVFNLLLNVSGIGPKSAMQMLGVAESKDILKAIYQEDEKAMSSFPGIGKKTAARIILELRDKVEKQFLSYLEADDEKINRKQKVAVAENPLKNDLTDTLVALGYHAKEIDAMFHAVELSEESDLNHAVKIALQYLTRS